MKKGLAKRILVSLLTVVMISAGVLPMLVSTANVARANENSTNTSLTDEVVFTTEHDVKDSAESGYVKVTFVINDTANVIKYVKQGDTVTVKSTDKNKGVLVGDADNGSTVSDTTTIYVKTYNYSDVLDIKKELVSEEPDENGYYTLKFTAKAKDMPSIHSAGRNDMVLVIDASLSMACAVDFVRVTDEFMADTYEETRWKAMYDAVDAFLDEFLPEGNTKNTISLVIYNESATKIIPTPVTSKSDVMSKLDEVFNEEYFNDSLNNSSKNTDGKIKVDSMKSKGKLASRTNVKAGLDSASEIFDANNNTNAKSIILFTDGVANRPNTNISYPQEKSQYNVGGTYDDNENEYAITKVTYDNGNYYIDGKKVSDATEIEAAYYANQKGQELAADNVTIYSFALIDNVTDNVRAAMGAKNMDMSEYVSKKSVKNKTNIELTVSPEFTYTDNGTGYANKFYATIDADELKKEFKNIIASLRELPFESASVTDKLDSHFELVSGQNGVTDNGDGTFTVKYADSHIKTEAQEITVKIKAKAGYAGYSYTNDGCIFNGEVDDLLYSQKFTDEPSAVIKPSAVNDSYTVNQDETLTVSKNDSVLLNDNNELVNNPDKNVSIKAEKVDAPKNGTVTFNEDGTFTYEPEAGFSGDDTFTYNTVLTVDGVTYKKSATVTITVIPKYTQTIKYEYADGTKASEDNVQTVIKNGYTTEVTSPKITGYKASVEKVEASQLTSNREYVVKYVKDDEQTNEVSYTVEYYKNGVKADSDEYSNFIWVKDDVQPVDSSNINIVDKFGTGYKYVGTNPASIPETIADKGVIRVYYVSDSFNYTVKYVLEGTETELADGYTKSAEFATEVGADKKNIEGYTVVDADKKLVVGSDESKNVLVIEYRINTYGYTVEYYYDDVKDDTATMDKTAHYNTQVTSYEAKEKTGYTFEKVENLPLTITTDASKNVIKVYYVKDADQTKDVTYTVKYYKDGEEVTSDTITVTKKVWINDLSVIDVNKADINTTDKYEGYTFDLQTTGIIPDKAENGQIIKVYYKKNVVVVPEEPTKPETPAPSEPATDNSKPETVQTGDSSNMMLYVLMLMAGVAGIATVVVTGRKKSEQ